MYFRIIAYTGLLIIACATRFTSLTMNSLWLDELFIINGNAKPFLQSVTYFLSDTHPPLFPLIAMMWTHLFGVSDYIVRILPVILGVLSVLLTLAVYKKLFGFWTAFIVAGLTCVLPLHIYFSQEFRNYSLGFLFVVLTTASLLFYIENPTKKSRWLFAISCGLLVGTHYLGIFYVVSACLIAAVLLGFPRRISSELWRLIEIIIVTIGVSMPHLIISRIIRLEFWPPPVSISGVIDTLLAPFWRKELAFAYLILAIFSIVFAVLNRIHRRTVYSLLALSILPLCGTVIVSLIWPNFSILIPNRVAILFVPPFLLLSGLGLFYLSLLFKRCLGCWLTVVGFAIMIGLSVWVLNDSEYYIRPTKTPSREVFSKLAEIEDATDDVFFVSIDFLWEIKNGYPHYAKQFGFNSQIKSVLQENGMLSLSSIEQEALRAGKKRLVIFMVRKEGSLEFVQQADTKYERIFTQQLITPEGGMINMYSLDLSQNISVATLPRPKDS